MLRIWCLKRFILSLANRICGIPCVKLTATSAFTVRDFHSIDYTHAGRTTKKPSGNYGLAPKK
ncbi:hypothetical protein, partial [Aeribacillus pallidus]|uniref:hypothetical protein n=1 Tax=Aeribacillus pallidus TaxID=33936 RepID=UPI003D1BE870